MINSGATAAFVAEDELAAGLLNGLFEAGKKFQKTLKSSQAMIHQLHHTHAQTLAQSVNQFMTLVLSACVC